MANLLNVRPQPAPNAELLATSKSKSGSNAGSADEISRQEAEAKAFQESFENAANLVGLVPSSQPDPQLVNAESAAIHSGSVNAGMTPASVSTAQLSQDKPLGSPSEIAAQSGSPARLLQQNQQVQPQQLHPQALQTQSIGHAHSKSVLDQDASLARGVGQGAVQGAQKGTTQEAALALAMTDIPSLESVGISKEMLQKLQVEELDASQAGADAKMQMVAAQQKAAKQVQAPTPGLSSDDYLGLRSFGNSQAKKNSKLALGAAELQSTAQPAVQNQLLSLQGASGRLGMGSPQIEAHVTTGSMMKPILSHDAIHQVTQQVNLMNQAKQDGEIKIRLKPDHLGELNMSIKNHGSQISVRIQAQDQEARQIIESSLSSLRDSLSQQQLTVARIEVTQAPTPTTGTDSNGMQMDLGQFKQGQSDVMDQRQQHQESMQNRNYWRGEESQTSGRAASSATSARPILNRGNSPQEGLDLIA